MRFYRDIANECGFLNLPLPECVQESTEKKLVNSITKNSSSKLTSRRGRPSKVIDCSVRKILHTGTFHL